MVIPDWTSGRRLHPLVSRLETTESPLKLARPLDRLAAAIIDIFILLVPVFILLSAPMKRWLMTSFILGAESEFVEMILVMSLLAVALVVSYQTLCHYFFGATVGKRVFDLRVIPMFEGETVGLWDHFLRSVIWVLELLAFGLPWLTVFSNAKRRPLHDRISDTIVVTRSPSGVKGPMIWERGLVRGLFAAIIMVFTLSLTLQIRGALEKIKIEKTLSSIVDRDLGDCEVVSSSVGGDAVDPHHRLKSAMTLYAAGLADRSCLESEVEGEIARQIPVAPITYLAQAFIYADDAEISNAYLDEVCESAPGTVECSMSQLVTSWSDEDWPAVQEILEAAPKGSGYMEVWGIRHYMKQAHYGRALATLDQLQKNKELAEFSLAQRVKALFNVYKEPEAIAAFKQAALTLPDDQAEDLGSWLCSQQLQASCTAKNGAACVQALADGETAEIDFERSTHAMAHVLALECNSEKGIDYQSFGEAVQSEDWRTFFAANDTKAKGDRQASSELFSRLILSDSAPEILRVEAARRWVQFASPKQMENLVENWMEFNSREGWVKIGNLLFSRLAEQKNSQLALKVAQRLAADEVLSPMAIKILAGFTSDSREPTRRPAQIDAGEQIKQLIKGLEVHE